MAMLKKISLLICGLVLLWGCDTTTDNAQKPAVVAKKIAATKSVRKEAPKNGPKRTASTQPAPKPKQGAAEAATAKQPARRTTPKVAQEAASPETAAVRVPPKSSPTGSTAPSAPRTEKASSGTDATAAEARSENAAQPANTAGAPAGDSTAEPAGSEAKAPAVAVITPTAEPIPFAKNYVPYDPKGKIDPFVPLFKEKPAPKAKKKVRRVPRTPLEKVDISQLTLAGIILAESGNKALVTEASGKGYVIKKGTYIGINSGQVIHILKDRVIIEEEAENPLGETTMRKRELKLQRPAGE